ncbi:MAG: hypothetical protein BMS9Abin37_1186 [Acidobacteriota bacterium]|nr:MAG: hypothetical protein BMS9Abin37_1186 [Acidobacteriota bacterium]
MKWILYSLAVTLLASGSLVASSTAPKTLESSQTEPETKPQSEPKDDDFLPTEKVPADSAISFPVDI